MTYCVTVTNIKLGGRHRSYFHDENLDVSTSEINADGFFDTPFNKESNDFDRTGVSSSKVSFVVEDIDDKKSLEKDKQEEWNLRLYSYRAYGCKIPQLTITVFCDEIFYKKLELSCGSDDQVQIRFEVMKWVEAGGANDGYTSVKAQITDIEIRSNNGFTKDALIDFEIKDIRNYLIRENCLNTDSGQVAEICKEFAESFRFVPANINRSELLDEVNSLIASYRSSFHSRLIESDVAKINLYSEKYGFEFNLYSNKLNAEFGKISDAKERYEVIRIFNNLWQTRSAEDMFKSGFPIGSGDAEALADEYIQLKYVYSITCEKILLDVLISCDIGDYADSAQFSGRISSSALLSIPAGFYKPEPSLAPNGGMKEAVIELVITSAFHIIGRIISGFISWWISGLIAGENETAHIVLFGTMFAADTVLMGLYQNHKLRNDGKDASKEEYYFNIIRGMCNLHHYSCFMDMKMIRYLLYQLASKGVKFKHQIFKITSKIESRS